MSGKFGLKPAGQPAGRNDTAGEASLGAAERLPEMRTILGAGCSFEGKLICSGPARLDGNFNGEIQADDLLLIESKAIVIANLKVNELVVHGVVRGNVAASKSISLAASAQIEGDIHTSCMTMEVGAQVKGKIDVAPQAYGVEAADAALMDAPVASAAE